MTTSWPAHALDEFNYKDAFQLAEIFELHCAKVYDHAATHPDDAASADYVMQLASQAYRAVHSLHMQTIASKYLDMGAATAALESKAIEYRESRGLSSTDENKNDAAGVETADEQNTNTRSAGLEDLLNGDFEEDDDEDSNWEESEEETDDEYCEYSEGSDSDSELDEMTMAPIIEETLPLAEIKQVDDPPLLEVNNATEPQTSITKDTLPPPPASIIQDQATHEKITAALRRLSLPCNEPEAAPLARVETHIDRPMTHSSAPPIDYTRSEATAVPTESGQQIPLGTSTTAPVSNPMHDHSLDATRLRRKLSIRSSRGLPRRLKTVCHKYVGRHFT